MTWEKRSIVGADRVAELQELYESLGFEVKVERFTGPDEKTEECDACLGDPAGEYYVLYTRKKSGA